MKWIFDWDLFASDAERERRRTTHDKERGGHEAETDHVVARPGSVSRKGADTGRLGLLVENGRDTPAPIEE